MPVPGGMGFSSQYKPKFGCKSNRSRGCPKHTDLTVTLRNCSLQHFPPETLDSLNLSRGSSPGLGSLKTVT